MCHDEDRRRKGGEKKREKKRKKKEKTKWKSRERSLVHVVEDDCFFGVVCFSKFFHFFFCKDEIASNSDFDRFYLRRSLK
jgi:hypothetical protein